MTRIAAAAALSAFASPALALDLSQVQVAGKTGDGTAIEVDVSEDGMLTS